MSAQPRSSDGIRELDPDDIGIYQFEGQSVRRENERRAAKWRPWTDSANPVRRLIGRIALARRLG